MKNYFTKKKVYISAVIIIFLVVLLILPIHCTEIVGKRYLLGDVGGTNYSRTCYSIYHQKFWTEVKERPTEYLFGVTALGSWIGLPFFGNQFTVPVGQFPHVEETIMHHSFPADFS